MKRKRNVESRRLAREPVSKCCPHCLSVALVRVPVGDMNGVHAFECVDCYALHWI